MLNLLPRPLRSGALFLFSSPHTHHHFPPHSNEQVCCRQSRRETGTHAGLAAARTGGSSMRAPHAGRARKGGPVGQGSLAQGAGQGAGHGVGHGAAGTLPCRTGAGRDGTGLRDGNGTSWKKRAPPAKICYNSGPVMLLKV